MKNQKLQGNELSFILLILISTLVYKLQPLAIRLYYQYRWYALIFFILSFISVLIFLYKTRKTSKQERDIFIGYHKKKPVFISNAQRTTHTQVIGTTGSGKTESVILPSIIQDIKNKNGVLIIDGKSDNDFLEKLYSYVIKFDRKKDFKLFSLPNVKGSYSFNPLKGNSSIEIAEKVFSAFQFENEYYRNIQYKIFLNLISLVQARAQPTFKLIHSLLTDKEELSLWLNGCKDKKTHNILKAFIGLSDREREERISGLEAGLAHFTQSECHSLFDETESTISINQALENGEILYFQLPTMLYPFLGSATGKLVLQSLQSAVSKRHLSSQRERLFSVYLDDFQDYIYQGFGSLLNKSRSANVAMVFSHQSLGDLEKVSSSFSDVVLTNTNLKIIMRTTDPKTCDYFAKYFGTKASIKETEQTDKDFFGISKTGRGSLRKVEEYIFHPNLFKKIPVGSGLISIPESDTVKHLEVSFPRLKPLSKIDIEEIKKESLKEPVMESKKSQEYTESIPQQYTKEGVNNEKS